MLGVAMLRLWNLAYLGARMGIVGGAMCDLVEQ